MNRINGMIKKNQTSKEYLAWLAWSKYVSKIESKAIAYFRSANRRDMTPERLHVKSLEYASNISKIDKKAIKLYDKWQKIIKNVREKS